MQHPAKQALACWIIAFALSLLALFVLLGAPASGDGMATVGGRLFAQTGLAALMVWLVARRRVPAWSWLRFAAIYTAVAIALGLIAGVGHARAAEALPFRADFSPGWSVDVLSGLSSAPQDQAAGVRNRAQWKGLDGMAVIELSCAWLGADEHPDVGAQLTKIAKGLADGYSKLGLAVETGTKRTLAKGARQWRAVDLHASDGNGPRLVQTVAITNGTRCLLTATLSGTPQAFAAQASEFESVLASLHVD